MKKNVRATTLQRNNLRDFGRMPVGDACPEAAR